MRLVQKKESQAPDLSAQVVISGGGNSGLDAALLAADLGAGSVTLLFREAADPLPLDAAKLAQAQEAGVHIQYRAAVTRLKGKEIQLQSVEVTNLDDKTTRTLPAGTLLLAAGRLPELILSPQSAEEKEAEDQGTFNYDGRWVARMPYKAPAFSDEAGLLATGDALSDFSGAIKAIGAGRRGAVSIQRVLHQLPLDLPEDVVRPGCAVQDVDKVVQVPASRRTIMPLAGTADPTTGGELEQGFSETQALAEAQRCLQCGLICYEHTQPPKQAEEAAPEVQKAAASA
jgi:NADPH-dependent glutamate synthase beta subunit-like oxidoreductase